MNLSVEHVLMFALVVCALYYLMGKCGCKEGYDDYDVTDGLVLHGDDSYAKIFCQSEYNKCLCNGDTASTCKEKVDKETSRVTSGKYCKDVGYFAFEGGDAGSFWVRSNPGLCRIVDGECAFTGTENCPSYMDNIGSIETEDPYALSNLAFAEYITDTRATCKKYRCLNKALNDTSNLSTPDERCKWFGEAPFCDGECPPKWIDSGRRSTSGGGHECKTGKKVRCCLPYN